jgi:hypothetical protein
MKAKRESKWRAGPRLSCSPETSVDLQRSTRCYIPEYIFEDEAVQPLENMNSHSVESRGFGPVTAEQLLHVIHLNVHHEKTAYINTIHVN